MDFITPALFTLWVFVLIAFGMLSYWLFCQAARYGRMWDHDGMEFICCFGGVVVGFLTFGFTVASIVAMLQIAGGSV